MSSRRKWIARMWSAWKKLVLQNSRLEFSLGKKSRFGEFGCRGLLEGQRSPLAWKTQSRPSMKQIWASKGQISLRFKMNTQRFEKARESQNCPKSLWAKETSGSKAIFLNDEKLRSGIAGQGIIPIINETIPGPLTDWVVYWTMMNCAWTSLAAMGNCRHGWFQLTNVDGIYAPGNPAAQKSQTHRKKSPRQCLRFPITFLPPNPPLGGWNADQICMAKSQLNLGIQVFIANEAGW